MFLYVYIYFTLNLLIVIIIIINNIDYYYYSYTLRVFQEYLWCHHILVLNVSARIQNKLTSAISEMSNFIYYKFHFPPVLFRSMISVVLWPFSSSLESHNLIFGSLMCISIDTTFEKLIWATVGRFPKEEQKNSNTRWVNLMYDSSFFWNWTHCISCWF